MFDPDLEAMPSARLRRLQEQRLRRLLPNLYLRVEFYRRRFDEAGVKPEQVRYLEDLPRLPLTRKEDLRAHYPFGLLAVGPSQIARIHCSSGTTGKPTVVGYSRRDLLLMGEVNARSLAAAGAEPGMILHNAYGYGLFTGGLGLHAGGERLGMTVVPVSGGMTERQLLLIQDFRPDMLCCTPSYAQTLCEAFRDRGIAPSDLSLRFAVLGAEPWTGTIRDSVDQGLGVRSTNLYGLSEIIGPGVSQECLEEREGSHVWEDHFYPEIVDPTSGSPLVEGREGVLVLTTLTKEAMPLLRYWTGDITSLDRKPCSCGRTHVRMASIKGRADDMLIIRGVNLYPTQIEDALGEVSRIAPHYQLMIDRRGALDEVRLEVEVAREEARGKPVAKGSDLGLDPTWAPLAQEVGRRIKEATGIRVEVVLRGPGEVPRSEGGKLTRVVDKR